MVISPEMNSTKEETDEVGCSASSFSRNSFRSQKGRLSNIVVVEVNKENLDSVWPYLLICIRNASFVSLDLELSGLGVQKGWLAKSLEERYQVIRQSAQSRSVISVGISTFQLLSRKEKDTKKKLKYKCQVFNILTLCSKPFVVESDGLQFLLKHKFDFNRWVKFGIPYDIASEKESTMRTLWREILYAAIPITLHNGLVDLTFIYQHFYSTLPTTFTEFVANISDWLLPENIPLLYDSKYIAEYVTRFKASYLEYVFRKCQRENAVEQAQNRLYISVEFDFILTESRLKEAVDLVDCQLPDDFNASESQHCAVSEQQKNSLCRKFSSYGFCRAKNCPYVHDVDILLNLEDQKQAKVRERRKRRYDYESKLAKSESLDDPDVGASVSTDNQERLNASSGDPVSPQISEQNEPPQISVTPAQETHLRRSVTGCHRAGVDSFMTGFAVIFMQRMSLLRTGNFDKECGNRIVLPCKTAPMVLHRSEYVQSGDDHIAKWTDIERERTRRAQLQLEVKKST